MVRLTRQRGRFPEERNVKVNQTEWTEMSEQASLPVSDPTRAETHPGATLTPRP